MKRVQDVAGLSAAGPYSFATIAGDTVYISGQIGQTRSGEIVNGGIEAQTHQTMKNLGSILQAAGASFADVQKTTIHLTDVNDFRTVNAIYGGYFPQGQYPARETIGVAALPLGASIEISMVATIPKTKERN